MPVKQVLWAFVAGTAMVVSIAAYAQIKTLPQTRFQVVSKLDQLESDKDVRQYKEMYPALSGANLIYAECGQHFDVTDGEMTYLKLKFDAVSKAYIQAYMNAYTTTTNSAPPQSFVDDVHKTLTKRQQDAVDGIALVLRQRGCTDGRLRPIVKYVERMRRQDKAIANQKPEETSQPYQ